jgi:hypothetical protein
MPAERLVRDQRGLTLNDLKGRSWTISVKTIDAVAGSPCSTRNIREAPHQTGRDELPCPLIRPITGR